MGSQDQSSAGNGGNGKAAEPYGDNLSPAERSTLRRAIAGSATGNAIEWYDYGIYGFLATTAIAPNFLPETPYANIIAFLIFAVPFSVRPLGAAIFGSLGDRIGRQRILALTVILISGGTFLIGVIPTFGTISYVAPTLLVILRIVQGLAAGGEYGGAATFMAEYSPDKKRGFLGSWLEFGTLSGFLLGTVLGSVLQFTLSEEAFLSWGWRIAFLVALPLGLFGLYMRTKLEDTPVFKELAAEGAQEQQTKTQFRDLFRHWRPILVCGGMVLMLNAYNYTLFVYMPSYFTNDIQLSGGTSLAVTAFMFAVMMVLMPLGGAASDRWGRKPSWLFSGITLAVVAIPVFFLFSTKSVPLVMLGLAILGILYVPQLSTISATFPAMFPTQIRYVGFALTYNIATAIAGGPTPAILESLKGVSDYMPAFYLIGGSVIGLVAIIFLKETAGASIRGTEVPDVEKQKAASAP